MFRRASSRSHCVLPVCLPVKPANQWGPAISPAISSRSGAISNRPTIQATQRLGNGASCLGTRPALPDRASDPPPAWARRSGPGDIGHAPVDPGLLTTTGSLARSPRTRDLVISIFVFSNNCQAAGGRTIRRTEHSSRLKRTLHGRLSLVRLDTVVDLSTTHTVAQPPFGTEIEKIRLRKINHTRCALSST